jgi:CTP synthase
MGFFWRLRWIIVNFPDYLICKLAYSQFIIIFAEFFTTTIQTTTEWIKQKYIFCWWCDFFSRKGIIAASLAKLLQARGYRATIQKFDPYLNVDPGTLNPYEHGECYDWWWRWNWLDLGHYERFLNVLLLKTEQ